LDLFFKYAANYQGLQEGLDLFQISYSGLNLNIFLEKGVLKRIVVNKTIYEVAEFDPQPKFSHEIFDQNKNMTCMVLKRDSEIIKQIIDSLLN